MKKNAFYLLTIIAIAMISICMTSCEKDEENDPEGTVTLKLRNGNNGGGSINVGNASISIDMANNFNGYNASFYDVGSVSGLSGVKSVPSSGWSDKVAVLPKHGYVAKITSPFYGYTTNDQEYEDKIQYMRIYVESYTEAAGSKGIIGATVKYQFPWNK